MVDLSPIISAAASALEAAVASFWLAALLVLFVGVGAVVLDGYDWVQRQRRIARRLRASRHSRRW